MFEYLRPVLVQERAALVELIVSGNVREQYDKLCGCVLTIDQTLQAMTEIEKKLAAAQGGDDDEDNDGGGTE
jgi:hypothetical protein